MILPAVKREIKKNGTCRIPDRITYSYNNESTIARLGGEAFGSFVLGAEYRAEKAFVRFELDESLEAREEIYCIVVSENEMRVCFRDERGAVNGAATAALLLRKNVLYQCEIIDYPSCSFRSVLIDMARGLPSEEDIVNTIKYMALGKYNRLHLHLMDSKGLCYRSDAVPEYVFAGDGGVCEKDLLRYIGELCRSYAIDVIPEIEAPAHAWSLCISHPEFKCEVEDAQGWAICPGNEDVWRFFETLIGEVAEMFPRSEYIHIGSDELEFRDLANPRFCHWAECPRCAELREREGLKDIREEFYYLIERLHGIVRSFGKKMMMWNDQIDVSKDVPISRDILIEFWRIACKGRGPYEGCSFEKLLENGFKVVNAYYQYTYFDIEKYLSAEKLKEWTPFSQPEHSAQYSDQILGGEACAWEFGNYPEYPFYSCVTPAVLPIFGDKLWGLGEREHTDEYKKALSEFIFGRDEFVEVFDCVGGLIPPRDKNMLTYADASKMSRENMLRLASRLDANDVYPVSKKYAELIGKIARRRDDFS